MSAALELVDLNECPPELRRAVRELRNEDAVRSSMTHPHVIAEAEHERWLERLASDRALRFWVALSDGRPVGGGGFSDIAPDGARADWGFYLSKAARGVGAGRALTGLLLDEGFDALGLREIRAEVLAFNAPSRRLHLSLGFACEGRRVRGGARRRDSLLFGLRAAQWRARRDAA